MKEVRELKIGDRFYRDRLDDNPCRWYDEIVKIIRYKKGKRALIETKADDGFRQYCLARVYKDGIWHINIESKHLDSMEGFYESYAIDEDRD